eukprot:CAMPEP_0172687024 /NCGR_PEP_ID=MMETSP1074-20121228/21364_1 /TAXON_ID=2916 /ORGANISM="Ceratium fusus, Strain PA161109" /LENGTH=309 /DNA_ID=CAMNT_0013506413 /DNA_START=46 /DNA_END=975 /DNA_ORIENTATION=+
MALRTARRGVLMTASSRRPRPEFSDDEEDHEDPETLAAIAQANEVQRKNSNEEWLDIEREVREEKRRLFATREFTSGRRTAPTVGYDDVASDAEEEDGAPDRPKPSETEAQTSDEEQHGQPQDTQILDAKPERPAPALGGEAAAAAEGREAKEEDRALPPAAVVTAGQQERERRRGGQKKTGAQKRREAEEAAIQAGDHEAAIAAAALRVKHGKKPKRPRDDEEADKDNDRWIKMRLEGEEKPKRIDATRVVSYFDFDSGGHLFPREQADDHESKAVAGAATSSSAAPSTDNFRASVRRDLWDGDDSEG